MKRWRNGLFAVIMVGIVLVGIDRAIRRGDEINEWGPVWSPDGQWIAYTSSYEKSDSFGFSLYRVRPDGSDRKRLVGGLHSSPIEIRWSPDSEWIVYESNRGNICRIRADGSDQGCLLNTTGWVIDIEYSPDGEWILFSQQDATDQFDLFRMRPDGSERQQLTNSPANEYYADWSPDGKWIVYCMWTQETGYVLYRMASDGSEHQRVMSGFDAQFSPDGELILYQSGEAGELNLYRAWPDGTHAELLTDDSPQPDSRGVWSPDGQWIVFLSNVDDQWDLFRMRTDGSERARLTDSPSTEWNVNWAPDNEWIVFHTREGDATLIYKMRADGSDRQRVNTYPESGVIGKLQALLG